MCYYLYNINNGVVLDNNNNDEGLVIRKCEDSIHLIYLEFSGNSVS